MKKKLTELKRESILSAAKQEFHLRSFQGASMDQIAARANVSKRTVYNHFQSKQNLYLTIVADLLERARGAADTKFDPTTNLWGQLRRIALAEVELMTSREYIELARLILPEYIRSPELARDLFLDFQRSGSGIMLWMREAHRQGRLRSEGPGMVSRQFIALLKSSFFWPQIFGAVRLPEGEERSRIIDSIVDLIMHHLQEEGS